MKSCKTCVHYTEDNGEVGTQFGKVIGGPVCRFLGHPLSNPFYPKNDEHIQRYYADDCSWYSESSESIPVEYAAVPVQIGRIDKVLEPTNEKVATCMGCKNLVRSSEVGIKLGWPASVCSKKGILVLRPSEAAQNCTVAEQGQPLAVMPPDFKLLDPYKKNFRFRKTKELGEFSYVEPRTYPSDKEVTPSDEAEGIRAWRKVADPEGEGADVYLPIFRDDIFTEGERLLIPKSESDEHPEVYEDYSGLLYQFAVDSWELDETLCLIGEPGLGKTEFGRWVAWLMQVPFRRFSFHKSSDVDDMVGKIKFDTDKGTYWVDGRITTGYRNLSINLADELNLAPNECKEILRSVMDNSKQLVLDQDEGLVVHRHPHTRLIVAINPPWDARNLGAEEFADAEVNRMSFSFVGWPPQNVEEEIIRRHCKLVDYEISDEMVERIVAIGADIREASTNGDFPGTWGIRQQIKVAKKTKFYGLVRAYKQTALNYYDPESVQSIVSLLEAS